MERTESDRLSDAEIDQRLKSLAGWSFNSEKNQIEKLYNRKNFLDAVSFIQQIATLAEEQDHHPDILLSDYKKIQIMLTTHSAKGITQNDFDLARAIDQLAPVTR